MTWRPCQTGAAKFPTSDHEASLSEYVRFVLWYEMWATWCIMIWNVGHMVLWCEMWATWCYDMKCEPHGGLWYEMWATWCIMVWSVGHMVLWKVSHMMSYDMKGCTNGVYKTFCRVSRHYTAIRTEFWEVLRSFPHTHTHSPPPPPMKVSALSPSKTLH
jgi:hypothetical protein